MTFSTDRDLLVLEPNLFRDAAWSALTRVSATDATVADTTLTSASSDFLAAGAAPGMIALVDGAALEVVEVLSSTELAVSRLRDGANDPPIPPLPVTNADLRIATFGPQRDIVHRQLLAALGLRDAGDDAGPNAASVLNTRDMALVESLGALHVILASAAAFVGESSTLWTRAAMHRDRFDQARRRLAARLDLNNDGAADAIRHATVSHLVRA